MTIGDGQADWQTNPAYDRHPDFTYRKGDLVRVRDGDRLRLFRVSADVTLSGYDALPGDFVDDNSATG